MARDYVVHNGQFFFSSNLFMRHETVANHFNFLSSLYFYKKLNDWRIMQRVLDAKEV